MMDSASAVAFLPRLTLSESSTTIGTSVWDWAQAMHRALVRLPSARRAPVRTCEAKLLQLAQERPGVLIGLIETNALSPSDLTFAAEIVGSIEDSPAVVPLLIRLLRHESPVVREGALYGLVHHAARVPSLRQSIRRAIESLARGGETSPGVRAASREALTRLDDLS